MVHVHRGCPLLGYKNAQYRHILSPSCRVLDDQSSESALKLLRADVAALTKEEELLDAHTETMQESLRELAEDPELVRLAYVTYDDICQIPSFANDTLIVIKAPSGTRLEVPDPDVCCWPCLFSLAALLPVPSCLKT